MGFTVDVTNVAAALLGLVGVVVGACLAGAFAHFQSTSRFNREKHWERVAAIRARLEELYATTQEVESAYFDSFTSMVNRVEYGADLPELEPIPVARMRMLIQFYAPELATALQSFDEIFNRYSEAHLAALSANSPAKPERQNFLVDCRKRRRESRPVPRRFEKGVFGLPRSSTLLARAEEGQGVSVVASLLRRDQPSVQSS